MEHFIAGGDESCFLASAGDVKIIGEKDKKKHEVYSANSRVSTTIYRTGFASGHTGPTAFLPPGRSTIYRLLSAACVSTECLLFAVLQGLTSSLGTRMHSS